MMNFVIYTPHQAVAVSGFYILDKGFQVWLSMRLGGSNEKQIKNCGGSQSEVLSSTARVADRYYLLCLLYWHVNNSY